MSDCRHRRDDGGRGNAGEQLMDDGSFINVIYQRNHGGYGVIQPRPEEQMNMNGLSGSNKAMAAVQPVLRMRA